VDAAAERYANVRTSFEDSQWQWGGRDRHIEHSGIFLGVDSDGHYRLQPRHGERPHPG
jgi:hypothetical protein